MNLITARMEIIDHIATGKAARAERQACGVSLREMARRMGLSAPYISDLELGRRCWSEALVVRWNKAARGKGGRQ